MKYNKTTNGITRLILSLMLCTLFLNLFFSIEVKAATINVSSIAELKSAIKNSVSDDIIILKDGTYLNTTLTIAKSGITIKSATPGGVFLNGTDVIIISGSNITFSGFQFTANTTMTGSPITVSGNSNTLTQLNFNGYSADHMIYITGPNNTISYSNFQNKPAIMTLKAGTGDLIQIIPNGIGNNKIQYCSFQHLPGMGGDYGNECIRIGNSSYATIISRTIVEYCYFEDTGLGDSETISVKSMENVLRFNTMRNNQQTNFCFRNGNNNVAYGNFFINAGGIRVKEANNIYCYNNYFENCGDGNLSAPIKYVYDETSTKDHLNNLNFIHNTFVGGTSIQLGKLITPNNGNITVTTFTNNTWANNIFKNNTKTKIFSEMVTGNSFAGNIYNGNLGINVASGMNNIDPLLMINGEGYYGLSSTSPAINAANAGYPAILDITDLDDDPNLLFDISGKSRPTTITLKDVGSDEFTTGVTTNHPLVLSEVGPSYLGGPSLSINDYENLMVNTIKIFPNQTNTSITVDASTLNENLVEIVIYNLKGQKLISEKIDKHLISNNQQYQLDVSILNEGVYFVKVVSENTTKTIKMILTQ